MITVIQTKEHTPRGTCDSQIVWQHFMFARKSFLKTRRLTNLAIKCVFTGATSNVSSLASPCLPGATQLQENFPHVAKSVAFRPSPWQSLTRLNPFLAPFVPQLGRQPAMLSRQLFHPSHALHTRCIVRRARLRIFAYPYKKPPEARVSDELRCSTGALRGIRGMVLFVRRLHTPNIHHQSRLLCST